MESGLVVEAAPIVGYTNGWTYDRLVSYFTRRGAKVQVVK